MKTTKENISAQLNAQLDAKKAERAQILAECKREKATAEAKLEAIKAAQAEAESPEAYKKDAAQIHELEGYIDYLNTRAHTTTANPILTKDEYKSIEDELAAEHKKILETCAPEIIKKFNELMQLMDEYTTEEDKLQSVLNLAQLAHYKKTRGGHFWHELKTKNPDAFGFFEDFCQGYFNRVDLIKTIKADKRQVNTFSNPDHGKIFAALHSKKQEAKE